MLAGRLSCTDFHAQRAITLMQTQLVWLKEHTEPTRQRVPMRPHANPFTPTVNEEPTISVFTDRAREKITVVSVRSLDYVGVEAPTLVGMHNRIDPQRNPRIYTHAPTLSPATDIFGMQRSAVRISCFHRLAIGLRRNVVRT
ncbi:hypothetical protein BN1232_06320 [Mycobacterium lentiflavum]|uniref:Uncharacterized protein n=1 Tax=Mycobacterium lentiflavum TaxID=141349 RepID=A0A0E4H319_MYCLN|nr:hypothetical protein BN1232_06320 [Mycobacterium lentiflavum]